MPSSVRATAVPVEHDERDGCARMTIDALAALQVNGLAKDYGDRPALKPITLTIGAGERVVMVGHKIGRAHV